MHMKKRKILSIILSGLLVASSFIMTSNNMDKVHAEGTASTVLSTDTDEPRSGNILIEVTGTLRKQDIQAAVDRINEIRREACDNGYPYPNDGNGTQLTTKLTSSDYVPIEYSLGMEKWALVRAAEASLYWGHTRPNSITTRAGNMMPINGTQIWLENLAAGTGTTDLVTAINQWYGEKNLYVNGKSGYGSSKPVLRAYLDGRSARCRSHSPSARACPHSIPTENLAAMPPSEILIPVAVLRPGADALRRSCRRGV